MRAHVLQHLPFEDIGSVAKWLARRGATSSRTRLYKGDSLPDSIDGIGLLVVLGGSMGAYEEEKFPWLVEEKRLIAQAIHAGVPTLGICLGAQLMAHALGARVYPAMQRREIGWHLVQGCQNLPQNAFVFPKECTVFQWHSDTFDLPQGSLQLAGSQACQNQAFQFGERAMGLQFHLEITQNRAVDLIHHFSKDLTEGGPYVLCADKIVNPEESHWKNSHQLMDKILDWLTRD